MNPLSQHIKTRIAANSLKTRNELMAKFALEEVESYIGKRLAQLSRWKLKEQPEDFPQFNRGEMAALIKVQQIINDTRE